LFFNFEKEKHSGNRIYKADKYAQIDKPLDKRAGKALIHTPENLIKKSTLHIQDGGTWIGVRARASPWAAPSFFAGREEEEGSESLAGSHHRRLFGFRRIFSALGSEEALVFRFLSLHFFPQTIW
jgi:hypothetical protein